MFLHILGRQPAIGLAELESLFGAEHVQPLKGAGALVKQAQLSNFSRLGGSIKVARVLDEHASTEPAPLLARLESLVPELLANLPEQGKIKFGISAYGLNLRSGRLNAAGLALKKVIKNAGRSVRLIPNQDAALSSAQVLHNKLTAEMGIELLLFRDGQRAIIAQTIHVQNIEAYAQRDHGRPMRDARVGMLPPKLAQMIINLANGPLQSPQQARILLDPFCGTGVILLEAALMGYQVSGSDLDERMVRYSRDNIHWLEERMRSSFGWYLEHGDATTYTWRQPIDTVAAETYLGTPLRELPSPQKLDEIISGCDELHRQFLKNLAKQLQPGTRVCLAVPAWRVKNQFRRLPVIDSLNSLGYNRIDFKHAATRELVYHRENQLVGRELLVLRRKDT